MPGGDFGAGLIDLDNGRGVEKRPLVTEDLLVNMAGACADSITGEPLGHTPNRGKKQAPVADFEVEPGPPNPISSGSTLSDERAKGIVYERYRHGADCVSPHVFHGYSAYLSGAIEPPQRRGQTRVMAAAAVTHSWIVLIGVAPVDSGSPTGM